LNAWFLCFVWICDSFENSKNTQKLKNKSGWFPVRLVLCGPKVPEQQIIYGRPHIHFWTLPPEICWTPQKNKSHEVNYHTCVCLCIYVYMYLYVYEYMYIYIHIHIYIYIYMGVYI
jgi:hypothetical protein